MYECDVDGCDVADGGHRGGRSLGTAGKEGELARRMAAHLWADSKFLSPRHGSSHLCLGWCRGLPSSPSPHHSHGADSSFPMKPIRSPSAPS